MARIFVHPETLDIKRINGSNKTVDITGACDEVINTIQSSPTPTELLNALTSARKIVLRASNAGSKAQRDQKRIDDLLAKGYVERQVTE
jgi:hypothetical protein